ncbi:MAG: hypothetical protein AAF628_03575 [Planctomycetota bacterium]
MREPAGLLLALLWLPVSCMTFGTALQEFDSVTGREGIEGEPDQLEYDSAPKRFPWLVRQLDGLVVDRLLRDTLGAGPQPTPVENPREFARERLNVLIDRAGSDLQQTAIAADRALWIAELGGQQPLSQCVAVRGIAKLLARLAVDPIDAAAPDPKIATEERVAGWLAGLQQGWPDQRPSATLTGEDRASYERALTDISERALPDAANRRGLILALATAATLEQDSELRERTREATLLALFHGLSLGLRAALYDPAGAVRQTAISAFRRLSGPRAVPFVLALMSKSTATVPRGMNRFDDDRQTRLLLVRMCGQLRGEPAAASMGGGPAPVEFLYETAVADEDTGLRATALEALAYCLEREPSFDPEWAERWWHDDYVPNRSRLSS